MGPLSLNSIDMGALVSYVSSLGGTSIGPAVTPPSASFSPAPAAAERSSTAVASKASAGNSAGDATVARGRSIFDSQGCNGCHGESGSGGTGPALAHISSLYLPAQMAAVQIGITAVLKAPTAKMKAGGMVPLSLNSADMEALVSYVSSVGGESVASAVAPSASASFSPEPAASGTAAAAAQSTAPTGGSAGNATVAQGKRVFDSQGCSGCHGEAGVGGPGPALTHTSSQYPPAQLTAVLKAPTAKMKASGMVPLTVSAADMKTLVSYVISLGGTSTTSTAASPAAKSSSPAPASTGQSLTATSKPESKKKGILRWLFLP